MRHRRYLASLFGMLVVAAVLAPASAPDVADAAPGVSVAVGDLNIVEADAGTTTVKVPIALTAPTVTTVAVKYAVTGATASAGSDYTVKGRNAKFKPGQFERWISVKVKGDAAVEANESVSISIVSAAGATVGDGTGVLTLTDNDANGVSATPEVTAGRPTQYEGNVNDREALVPLRLSRPSATPVRVRYGAQCEDKLATFKAGQMLRWISVSLPANVAANPDYTIPSTVAVTGGAAAVATPTSGVSVRDDDGGGSSQPVGTTIRASETALGREAKFPTGPCEYEFPRSREASINANGRYVVFTSNATNLVPGDTNGLDDVFVKDLWTGAIERVSVSSGGGQADNRSAGTTISPDGRFVIFWSMAGNLAPGQFGWWWDQFIHDRVTRTTTRLLPGATEITSGGSMSADNRYIAFDTMQTMAGDSDPVSCPPSAECRQRDVFVLDRTTLTVTLVTTGQNGDPALGNNPVISADGKSVAFRTDGQTEYGQVWVRDLDTGITEMASVNNAGQPAVGFGVVPDRPSISADGQQVAFVAEVCNLGIPCHPVNGRNPQVAYVRDRNTRTTTHMSVGTWPSIDWVSFGVSLSADGRYVTFATTDKSVIPGWSSKCDLDLQVIQRDRVTRQLWRVSSARDGSCPNGASDIDWGGSAVSANGAFVVFSSWGTDIVTRDHAKDEDVFVTRLR